MKLFRRVKAAIYRWRIARLDRRLDALQARRREQVDFSALRHLGLEFDTLAIHRAVLARRLGRLAGEVPDITLPPRRAPGALTRAEIIEHYLLLEEELDAHRAAQDDVSVERLSQELVAAQRAIEAGRSRRAS
jgi:hypothetical protein